MKDKKSFQNIFFETHFFYFLIYKFRIHKTCSGKDIPEIFRKEQSGSHFLKGKNSLF